jgi:hypothetical protein
MCLFPGDLHQIVIHDNTYRSNRFKLPLGVFCTPNRHGQSTTTATCLTFKEGTADYEWAYRCYLAAVGIPPNVVFTDADPAASAAVANVWPLFFHGWCIWHIYINISKNLNGLLGDRLHLFKRQFGRAQCQITKHQFWMLYNQLKVDFPEAAPYLDTQLTPHVEHWAAYALETFTAGGNSTQRGGWPSYCVCVCVRACFGIGNAKCCPKCANITAICNCRRGPEHAFEEHA